MGGEQKLKINEHGEEKEKSKKKSLCHRMSGRHRSYDLERWPRRGCQHNKCQGHRPNNSGENKEDEGAKKTHL